MRKACGLTATIRHVEAAAAWAAALVAVWVAFAQARSSRQQLRREAVAEVDVRSSQWLIAVGNLLGGMRQFQNGKQNVDQINGPLLSAFTAATADLNRALRVAEMVCSNKQLREIVDAMTLAMGETMRVIAPKPDNTRPAAEQIAEVLDQVPGVVSKFTDQSAAFVFVGMRLYRLRGLLPRRRVSIEGK